MTYDELNAFILNYLENDITNRAIMLTGEWGSGKSYYVKNILKSFLESKEGGKHKCAIISLYGFSDVSEISKAIYMEFRTILKETESEAGNTAKIVGKIVGKSIINGLVSKIGFDIGSISDEDIQKVYNSIDLSNKLIVLEDIERTRIDIVDLFGYINNMCENDGVKLLLVTNEEEILTTYEDTDEQGKKIKYYTDSAISYMRTKEKTVGDTIVFYSPYIEAIKNIIERFNNKYLNSFLDEKNEYGEPLIVNEIYTNIMSHNEIDNYNLRSFIFACQKTVDMLNFVNDSYDQYFLKHIFLSNVAFCLKLKANENLRWEDENKGYSSKLATSQYPLYRISYDFIKYQWIDSKELKEQNDLYVRTQKHERDIEKISKDLQCLYAFYINKEYEVIVAINNIISQLETNSIPLTEYGKLANYLIAIKSVIGQEDKIESCKKIMLNNLSDEDGEVEDRITFHDSFSLEGKYAEELSNFEEEMLQKVKKTYSDSFDFNYIPEKVPEFCRYVYNNRDKFVSRGAFAVKINIDEFIRLLENCSAEQMSDLRNTFLKVYSFSNIDEYFIGDKEALTELKNRVEDLRSTNKKFDKIQLMQLEYLCSNLQRIITKLENH